MHAGPADEPRVPRSPTGRIPQWVLDEAVGRRVEPTPWRGPTGPVTPAWHQPARRRRGRTLAGLLVVLAVTVGGTMAVNYFQGRTDAPLGPAIDGVVAGAPVNPGGPPPGYEESGSPLGVPPQVPPLPEGTGYRFMTKANGRPITWSPCRPIHVVVRTANEPARGADLLTEAITTTSTATGLQFVDDGSTEEGPSADRQSFQPDRYGKRWAPVLVTWATPAEVADFAGNAAGEAGPTRIATPSGDVAYVSGTVYLDPAKFSAALQEFGPGVARALILHELGHLVGLAHVADPAAVMFPTLTGAVTGYSPGDRAGLAALGRGPCEPHV